MTTKTKGKRTDSPILASVHEAATGLHRIGLANKSTMRGFEALCLTPAEPLAPEEIRARQASFSAG
jgi:putative transcriptional regulator